MIFLSFELQSVYFLLCFPTPGTKYQTVRWRKCQPLSKGKKKPSNSTIPSVSSTSATIPVSTSSASTLPSVTATTATTASPATPRIVPTSQKKLSKSAYVSVNDNSCENDFEMFDVYEWEGMRMLEVAGLQIALEGVCCKECGSCPIVFKEDFSKKQGLYTAPSLYCENRSLPHLFLSLLSAWAKF